MTSGGRPQGRPPVPLSVEAGVDEVDVLLVELFLGKPQPLTSTGRVEWRNGAANKSADRYNILRYHLT